MMHKQISEMAKCCPFLKNGKCQGDLPLEPDCDLMCKMYGFITNLIQAGYRKQSENATDTNDGRKSEWISVDERLPERTGKYLVFTFDRRIYICNFIDHYCNGDAQFDDYKVTHWMPLPEAPKGDKTDA